MAKYIILITIDLCPQIIARWAPTIAIQEHNNTNVFTKGSIKGSNVSRPLIPMGGQIAPIAIEGDKLPWKKAQKNGKNNIASEIKNNNIPYFNASCTRTVW